MPGPQFRPVTLALPDFDPRLRTVPDDDPLVEEMVERLRRGMGGLVAVDRWGRPMPWRDVVRVALGGALGELRDARTARALAAAVRDRGDLHADLDEPADEPADEPVGPELFVDLPVTPRHAAGLDALAFPEVLPRDPFST